MRATRREVLKTIMVAAGTLGFGEAALATATVSGAMFPQGVASGDPKPDSVILWTRIVDPLSFNADIDLRLQVATSKSTSPSSLVVDVPLTAKAENYNCVRVKITGLEPRRYCWYRFLSVDGSRSSIVGRTRTAPAPDQQVPVRFAFASCQDYIGRWYNSYLPLLQPENDDLDFLLHIGDFIYETTGDPSFQSSSPQRSITFSDQAGAIQLGTAPDEFYAASSLSNYRQLHRTYRSDPALRQVLAKFPLVAIWDDHEFSDDSWQANATYFDGRRPERDVHRLQHAEKAWLEFMPIDDTDHGGAPADIIDTGPDRLYPDIRIYRGLRFGKAVNLTLADYRSYRADHIIPEDAFPATIVATREALQALSSDQYALYEAELDPYIDWSVLSAQIKGALTGIVTAEYAGAGYVGDPAAKAAEVLTGPLSVAALNLRIVASGLPIWPISPAGLPRGLSYQLIGKFQTFTSYGSRYALIAKWFDLFAQVRGIGAEAAWGKEQTDFIRSSLLGSADASWNVVANSVSNTSMIIDLTLDLDAIPEFATLPPVLQTVLKAVQSPGSPLRARVKLNADQWDGFPLHRAGILDFARQVGNVVIVAGDIHSSWVTDHSAGGRPLFEFTGPAISSSSFGQLILDALVISATGLGIPQALLDQLPAVVPDLVRALNSFLVDREPVSPFVRVEQKIEFIDVDSNGIVIVDANAETMKATYWLLPATDVLVSYYGDPATGLSKFQQHGFQISKTGGLQTL